MENRNRKWVLPYSLLFALVSLPLLVSGSGSFTQECCRRFPLLQKMKCRYHDDSPRSILTTLDHANDSILILRGGASKKRRGKSRVGGLSRTATGKKKVGAAAAEAKKQSAVESTLEKYKNILPLTRLQLTMVGITTIVGLVVGEELAQSLMALDPIRTLYGFELWRPLTAATFLGPPKLGWLMNAYFLFEYGSTLERVYGTAQHLIFIVTQIFVLSFLSILLGQPFFASPFITAMLHVLSRSMPDQKVKWLIFTVPYWSLPYGLMASDVLNAQSAMAALPHILGILGGHFYHFHKFVWPQIGGEDWLVAPDFLTQRLDPNAKNTKDTANQLKDRLKKRKRGKGRKLGDGK